MSFKKYLNELKRRNVIKASLAYLVVSWLIVQVAAIILPTFNAPSFILKTIFLILGLGFPIWLVFSWVYEMTPEGLKKTKSSDKNELIWKQTNSRLNKVLITTLLMIIAFLLFTKNENGQVQNEGPDITIDSLQKSIAVLPFRNISPNDDNMYFADGLVEDLLYKLSTVDELKVISRTSSETFRNRADHTAPEIASKLGITHLVEGSVQKSNNTIRVMVQLIDAANDENLWTKSYDHNLVDLFKIQNEIALEIVKGLKTILTDDQVDDLQKNRTENLKAFDLYQLGRLHYNKRTLDDLRTSITFFEKAIEEDQNYALAYANMADSYFLLYVTGNMDENDLLLATEKAQKALEIDEKIPEAYNVLGGITSFIELDWETAENVFLEGLKHNPNHANLHHRYSEHLTYTGRYKEARIHIDKAIELNPLSFIIRNVSAHQYDSEGEFDKALDELEICYQLVPDKNHYRVRNLWFELSYRFNNAEAAIEIAKKWSEDLGYTNEEFWGEIYADSGLRGVIYKHAELMSNSIDKASLYVLIDEREQALNCLEDLYNANPMRLRGILGTYSNRTLLAEPRFKAILEKLNLPWSPEN